MRRYLLLIVRIYFAIFILLMLRVGSAQAAQVYLIESSEFSVESLIKFSCGSDLLNMLLLQRYEASQTEVISPVHGKKMFEVAYRGVSVVWGGELKKQDFVRSRNLASAFINNLTSLDITKSIAIVARNEFERLAHIDKDYMSKEFDQVNMSKEFDQVNANGAAVFFYFSNDRVDNIAIDCGQVEPQD